MHLEKDAFKCFRINCFHYCYSGQLNFAFQFSYAMLLRTNSHTVNLIMNKLSSNNSLKCFTEVK